MLAPVFHPSMKRVASIRRELATRTVFNILGPLTNPAGAPFQVMGVYDPRLCDKLALALKILGTERALVVHGSGLDEITNTGPTRSAHWIGAPSDATPSPIMTSATP